MSFRVPPLGPFLGPSWAWARASWALLGRLGVLLGLLGPSWRPVGPSWGDLRASWAVMDAVKQVVYAKKCKFFPKEWEDFCFLGPCWRASSGSLGASWRPLGLSGGHLGRLGTIFRRVGAPWTVSGASRGSLGALLERSGGVSRAAAGRVPGCCRAAAGVLFVPGPPGAATRARTRKYCIVNV